MEGDHPQDPAQNLEYGRIHLEDKRNFIRSLEQIHDQNEEIINFLDEEIDDTRGKLQNKRDERNRCRRRRRELKLTIEATTEAIQQCKTWTGRAHIRMARREEDIQALENWIHCRGLGTSNTVYNSEQWTHESLGACKIFNIVQGRGVLKAPMSNQH